MRKTIGLCSAILVLAISTMVRPANAQDESKPGTDENKTAEHRNASAQPGASGGAERPIHPYRAEFLITELENGKKVNSRHYSMLLNAGFEWNRIQIGTRVPSSPDTPGQFLDVGTNINCRVMESGADVELGVHSDFSNFFSAPTHDAAKPIIRQISI